MNNNIDLMYMQLFKMTFNARIQIACHCKHILHGYKYYCQKVSTADKNLNLNIV